MVWVAQKNKLHFPEFEIKLKLLIPQRQWSLSKFPPTGQIFPATLPRPLRQRRAAALGSEHLTTAPEGKVWGFAAIRASAPTATPHNEFSLPTAAVQPDGRPLPSTELGPNIRLARGAELVSSHERREAGVILGI